MQLLHRQHGGRQEGLRAGAALKLRALPALGLLLLTGCLSWLPAPTPMTAVHRSLSPHARCLVVLLPGLGDGGQSFEKEGAVALLAQRGLSAEVVAADAGIGYYARGSLETRLHADLVAPLRPERFAHVVFVGISMGGWGSLWYAHEHPRTVEGILLLSPYLGRGGTAADIQREGGLASWKGPPRAPQLTEENNEREIWRWLQAVKAGQEPGPRLTLGYGTQDRGMEALATLAHELPPERVFRAPGPHDWPTWRALLKAYLEAGALDARCRD